MKRSTISLLAAAAALCVLTACQKEEAPAAHIHAAEPGYQRNAQEHWKQCQCTEKLEIEAHIMEGDRCTVCDSYVYPNGDGSATVINYNENGDYLRSGLFDAAGNAMQEDMAEYDETGFRTMASHYEKGRLVTVTEYKRDDGGRSYDAVCSTYRKDGSYESETRDENGRRLSLGTYDKNNKMLQEIVYTYEAIDSVDHLAQQTTTAPDGSYVVERFNQYGHVSAVQQYDAAGSLTHEDTYEYEYSADGKLLQEKRYENDTLQEECTYTHTENGSYLSKMVQYMTDGSIITTITDAAGNETTETQFPELTEP